MARNRISGADSSSAAKFENLLKNVTVTEDTTTGKVYLDIWPSTVGAINVSLTAATQYTEGTVTSSAAGIIAMWKQSGGTITSITPSFPLPVYMATGSAASVQYSEGAVSSTFTGDIFLFEDPTDTASTVSKATPLPVNVITVGSLPLPSGAATSAKQDTTNAYLATVSTDLLAIKTAVESLSAFGFATALRQDTQTAYLATLSALQASALVSLQSLSAYSFATSAKQDTTNSYLATISADLLAIKTATQSLSAFGFATATRQDTTNAYLATVSADLLAIKTAVQSLSAFGFATAARQDTQTSYLAPQSAFDHGSLINITTAALTLGASFSCKVGVLVKASVNNTARLWAGNSDVTSESTVTTDGFELAPGESIFIGIDSPSKIFLIGETTAAQRVSYSCL